MVYTEEGVFTVTLTVTDSEGRRSSDTVSVTVADPAGFVSNFDQVSLRGTFNDWGTDPMALVGDNLWQATAVFTGNDNNERFKFDIFGDWSENYGDTDIDGTADRNSPLSVPVYKGSYVITFNDQTLTYSAERQADTNNYRKDVDSVDLRGTFNGWGKTQMILTDHSTWELIFFDQDSDGEARIKFYMNDKWYGDSDKDGETHSNEKSSIRLAEGGGVYRIRLTDKTRKYTVDKL